jgi:hypothetical protein
VQALAPDSRPASAGIISPVQVRRPFVFIALLLPVNTPTLLQLRK